MIVPATDVTLIYSLIIQLLQVLISITILYVLIQKESVYIDCMYRAFSSRDQNDVESVLPPCWCTAGVQQ